MITGRHDPAEVPKALRATLNDLGVVYLDLYLMHWPVAKKDGKYAIDYLDVRDIHIPTASLFANNYDTLDMGSDE